MRTAKKPTVRATSLQWLSEIDQLIRQYDYRGERLAEAASDALDGSASRRELDDLIRRGFLQVVRYGRDEGEPCCDRWLCGRGWSVLLTAKAQAAFWPERRQRP
ncbi:MAG: hypothetical protein ACO1SX_25655 [Actinomycetota bacterium]